MPKQAHLLGAPIMEAPGPVGIESNEYVHSFFFLFATGECWGFCGPAPARTAKKITTAIGSKLPNVAARILQFSKMKPLSGPKVLSHQALYAFNQAGGWPPRT